MSGTRNNAIENESIVLQYQFLKEGNPFDVETFLKVEIYASLEDAENEVNAIETITSITRLDVGLYEYTVSPISTFGTYFDKVFITPELGEPTFTQINSFYVRKGIYGGIAPEGVEKAIIVLSVSDITGSSTKTISVKVKMNQPYAWYNNNYIKQEQQIFDSNGEGIVEMDLIETDTLGTEIHYIVEIDGMLKEKVKVPKGTISANYKDLPRV